MLKAKDIMNRDVVTVRPETTLTDAIDKLLQGHISGLVVTDEHFRPVGVITEFALLAVAYDPKALNDPVRRHMTTDVISVGEEDSLRKVADLCITHRVRRVPVVRDGELVGLISRRDVLRGIWTARETSDRDLQLASPADLR